MIVEQGSRMFTPFLVEGALNFGVPSAWLEDGRSMVRVCPDP